MRLVIVLGTASVAGVAGFCWTLAAYEPPPTTGGHGYGMRRASSDLDHVRRLFREGRVLEAAPVVADWVRAHPLDPDGWYWMGWCDAEAGRPDQAAGHWRRAAALQRDYAGARPDDLRAIYDLARYSAVAGERDAALSALERAAEAGWPSQGRVLRDRAFDSVREDPRFVEVIAKIPPGEQVGG